MPTSPLAPRLATRLAFFVSGFGIAAWAPLVPFAKQRLHIDDGTLGALLLCIGIGSTLAMTVAGPLSARYGAKPLIVVCGLAMAVLLPCLTIANTFWTLALVLVLLGANLGALDVAMNLHAVEVEHAAQKPMMSGFHALYSIGGFVGASFVTALLSLNLSPTSATLICTTLMIVATLYACPRLLTTTQSADGPLFIRPRGIVLLLAALAGICFLVEGAMLDWSALYVASTGMLPRDRAGIGYMLFAIAMTAGRLVGDRLNARIGDSATLCSGGLLAVVGFIALLLPPHILPNSPSSLYALAGFPLIGLGASNIVPVLFRQAARQTIMPTALALGAITTVGYAGVLSGPALVGFISKLSSLPVAFSILAMLMLLVPAFAHRVTR